MGVGAIHRLTDVVGVKNAADGRINPATEDTLSALKTSLESRLNTLGRKAEASSAPVVLSNEDKLVLDNIETALLAQLDLAATIWTDDSGSFYVRRDVIAPSGSVTVTFTDPTGAPATPGAGLRPVSDDYETEQTLFDATAGGTGYSSGNILARIVIIDTSAMPPTTTAIWSNLTLGTTIGTPTPGTYIQQTRNVAVTSLPTGQQSSPGSTPVTLATEQETLLSATATSLGPPSSPESASGDGTVIGILKRLRTIVSDVWQDAKNRFLVGLTDSAGAEINPRKEDGHGASPQSPTYVNQVERELLDPFGRQISMGMVSQVPFRGNLPIANNRIGTSTTGSGTATTTDGYLELATGTATGTATALSTDSIRYSPHRGFYWTKTAVEINAPTHTSAYWEMGLDDGTNGYLFRRYHDGVSAKAEVCIRRGGVLNNRATVFNEDPLDGSATSLFTENGVPVAVNWQKGQIIYMQGGWHGFACLEFFIESPDGHPVLFHRIRYPNNNSVPHTTSPDLPLRMKVDNGTSGAVVKVRTSSWDAGIIDDSSAYDLENQRGRTGFDFDSGVLSGAGTTTVRTTPTGRVAKVSEMLLVARNDSIAASATIVIRNGSSGSKKTIPLSPSTNQSASQVVIPMTFPVNLQFPTSIVVVVTGGTVTWALSGSGKDVEA